MWINVEICGSTILCCQFSTLWEMKKMGSLYIHQCILVFWLFGFVHRWEGSTRHWVSGWFPVSVSPPSSSAWMCRTDRLGMWMSLQLQPSWQQRIGRMCSIILRKWEHSHQRWRWSRGSMSPEVAWLSTSFKLCKIFSVPCNDFLMCCSCRCLVLRKWSSWFLPWDEFVR